MSCGGLRLLSEDPHLIHTIRRVIVSQPDESCNRNRGTIEATVVPPGDVSPLRSILIQYIKNGNQVSLQFPRVQFVVECPFPNLACGTTILTTQCDFCPTRTKWPAGLQAIAPAGDGLLYIDPKGLLFARYSITLRRDGVVVRGSLFVQLGIDHPQITLVPVCDNSNVDSCLCGTQLPDHIGFFCNGNWTLEPVCLTYTTV